MSANRKSVSIILGPYKTSAIVEATGAHPDTVRAWRRGESSPGTEHFRALSELTGATIEEIVTAVEATIKARAAA